MRNDFYEGIDFGDPASLLEAAERAEEEARLGAGRNYAGDGRRMSLVFQWIFAANSLTEVAARVYIVALVGTPDAVVGLTIDQIAEIGGFKLPVARALARELGTLLEIRR